MSYQKTNIQLSEVLPQLSSKRHSFFEDEKEQIIQAIMNCPHFQSFLMDESLKKAIEACYEDINYFLYGATKILHQYGKNTENQFFIIKGEANVYEYKKDSELEIECFYTASRSKLKETIDQKKNQLKNIEQALQSSTNQNPINGIQSQETQNIAQSIQKDLQSQLNNEISVIESELKAVEKILDQKFAFFDSELEVIRGYQQFFIDEVCLLKFVKKLKESDSFGIVDNNRDQIIVSATEIHLTNLTTEIYQINLIPLKAINEFFAFYLKECKLDNYIQFRNLYESYYNKGKVVYDTAYKPVKGKKGNKKDSDNDTDEDKEEIQQKEEQNQFSLEINTIYLVRRGVFQISKLKEKRFLPIRTLYPGDFFGIEDLFLNNHQFRVTCLSDKSSVIAYNVPLLKDGLSQNMYTSGEFINTKQKEKLQDVQQKFLQYYVKVYLDVLEQSVENNKNFANVFGPIVNNILKKDRDPNFRKEEEAREKKFIKLDGLILEMPIEVDAPKGRFDIKLQPYQINMKKLERIQGQQEQKNQQQQSQNLEQLQKQISISNQNNPSQNSPDMTQLVNKLQIKINSRKQSQEKINYKKKGSQIEMGMGQTINSGSSNLNSETVKIGSRNFSSQNLSSLPNETNSTNNRFQLAQQIQDNENQFMVKLKKQQSMTNYSFQPYAAKQNSRDISPQSNNFRKVKKNFTIAPISIQKEQFSSLINTNTPPLLNTLESQANHGINEAVKQNQLHIAIKEQSEQDNQYLINSNHNKAIPKTYQDLQNTPQSLQKSKTKLFKKQFSKTSSKEANSPLSNNYKSHLSYENMNTINQQRISMSNFKHSRQTSNNQENNNNHRNSDSSPDIIDRIATQQENIKKKNLKTANILNSNQKNNYATKIDIFNDQQNSSDSLPYISQNLSSSSLILDKTNKNLTSNNSSNAINTSHLKLSSTNHSNNQQGIHIKTISNSSFKNYTESSDTNTNKNPYNSYYSPYQKQGLPNNQTIIPSLNLLDNQNKQQINQIYYEGTSSMSSIPTKKPYNNSQNASQAQESFISHSSNKMASSMIANGNSPQSNKNTFIVQNLNSENVSEIPFSRKSSSQKLINLQQQPQQLFYINPNSATFTSTTNQLTNNQNKQIFSSISSQQDHSHQHSQQAISPKKLKGLLDSKNENRNQLNMQNIVQSDMFQTSPSKSQNFNIKKQNSPQVIERNQQQ